jgi:hypothetical protein
MTLLATALMRLGHALHRWGYRLRMWVYFRDKPLRPRVK